MTRVFKPIRKWRTNALAKNASWMMLGQGLGIFSQALCFIGLARLLGASEYGVYAGTVALVSILSQYSPLGSGLLFLRYVSGDKERFARFWGNILLATTSVGSLIVLGLYIVGPAFIGTKSAGLLIPVAIGDCICGQLTTAAGQVFQTFERMGVTAILNLATSFVRCLLACGMLLLLHRATATEWALASLGVSLLATAAALLSVTASFGFPKFSPSMLITKGREGIVFAISGSTTSAYNDLDKAMLSHYGMNAANGIYSMAYRVVDICTIPIRAIQGAAMPKFFREGVNGAAATLPLAHRIVKRTRVIGALAAVGMFVTAPLLPSLVGTGFSSSVLALRWLCLIPLLRSFHLSAGDAITGAGFQRFRLATQFAAAASNFALNLWLIPAYGWKGAAWASLITDGGLGALNWSALRFLGLRQRRESGQLNVQPQMLS